MWIWSNHGTINLSFFWHVWYTLLKQITQHKHNQCGSTNKSQKIYTNTPLISLDLNVCKVIITCISNVMCFTYKLLLCFQPLNWKVWRLRLNTLHSETWKISNLVLAVKNENLMSLIKDCSTQNKNKEFGWSVISCCRLYPVNTNICIEYRIFHYSCILSSEYGWNLTSFICKIPWTWWKNDIIQLLQSFTTVPKWWLGFFNINLWSIWQLLKR